MTEDLQGLIAFIYHHEANGNLNAINHGVPKHLRPAKPLTEMTVGEVLAWQRSIDPQVSSEAAGALQIMPDTLAEEIGRGTVKESDLFDKATQDKLTIGRLRFRGLDKWKSGALSREEFGTNVAKEWASLPVLTDTYSHRGRPIRPGNAFYGGVGNNPNMAFVSAKEFSGVLDDPGSYDPSRYPVRAADPAGGTYAPASRARYAPQFERTQAVRDHTYPWRGEAVALGRANAAGLPNGGKDQGYDFRDMPPLPDANYDTRTGRGGGPIKEVSPLTALMDEAGDSGIGTLMAAGRDTAMITSVAIYDRLGLGGIVPSRARNTFDVSQTDPAFDPLKTVLDEGLEAHWSWFEGARNATHYEKLKRDLTVAQARAKRRQVYDGWVAPFVGGMLNPDTLVSLGLPGGIIVSGLRRAGLNALRSGVAAASIAAPYEVGVEALRRRGDPLASYEDSAFRAGSGVLATGLFGGAFGAALTPAARNSLAEGMARDMARARGIGDTTTRVQIGDDEWADVVIDDGAWRTEPRVFDEVDDTAPTIRDIAEAMPADTGRGVTLRGTTIVVDPDVIAKRMAAKTDLPPDVRNANELVEYEVGYAAALARRLRAFMGDESGALNTGGKGKGKGKSKAKAKEEPFVSMGENTEPVANMGRIEKAMREGTPIILGDALGKKLTPIEVDPRAFGSADEAKMAIEEAHYMALKARDDAEFQQMVSTLFGGRGKLEKAKTAKAKAAEARAAKLAEEDAARHLEGWRQKNNRILQSARMEAMGRLLDSPYKRLHRNGLTGAVRDLADKLVGDGGLLRGSDAKGMTVGPSVAVRAKTWKGVVRRLWDTENRLYAKYLGMDTDPTVADVSLSMFKRKRVDGSKAMPREEWRRRVSMAHITGVADEIPEINEMASHIKAAWAEYKAVSETYGVITSDLTLGMKEARLQQRLDNLMGSDSKLAKDLQAQLDQIRAMRKMAKEEPGEDYFTRVYAKRAIEENREWFKENIVKPWMVKQPWVDVWQPGKDELKRLMVDLRVADAPKERIDALQKRIDAAPDYGKWERVRASTEPHALDARADEFIRTILDEADPTDLTTLREANRPVFGRHRQFRIPNAMLLKDGPKGNGMADFIETDYMLLHAIYADRMGPAIEMARSFGSVENGVSGAQGFDEALLIARNTEFVAWEQANPQFKERMDAAQAKGKPRESAVEKEWGDHWSPIERDILHLKDRATNRVIRAPERWDNRAATALRNWGQLVFMGGAALPAIQEVGMLILRHGASRVWRTATLELDAGMNAWARANVGEMRAAGAILEVANGTALSRMAETGMEATTGTAPERWLKTMANRYFLWNGLAPLTTRLKEIDAIIRVHDLTARIDRVGRMKLPEGDDLAELARYGISRKDAEAMAQQPIMQTDEGHWQANTAQWGDEDLVRKFRAAIAQGNENTILMATAADKPTIIDGTIYLRRGPKVDEYALKLGLRQVGDYWQVQSGLMSLPFMFWNYSIAAYNKILLAGLQEPDMQKLGGIAAMMGLGYMVASVRGGDQWENRPLEDRMAQAIDQSGVTGVIANYVNYGQGMAEATGLGNPLPFSRTRGMRYPGMGDMMEQVAGPAVSAPVNLIGGVLTGDAEQASWGLPFRNFLLTKGLIDAAVDGQERRAAGLD